MQTQKELRNQAVGKIDWTYQGVDLVPCLSWDAVLSSTAKVFFVLSLKQASAVLFFPTWASLQLFCSRVGLIGLQCSSCLLVEIGQEGDQRARTLFTAKV